ncbi:hypothetical protein NONO_c60820 [Nocardia nova SH22a]|uniref:Uncharacterized protein n=1 Tax=Nocardia nova SH22a TaxID=1415166 RepID=W5TPM7_9NOCA|nr:hypothetical protein [Nocardia nova]AHH20858.1 hypothetical protein NONO_c60820 [Nocardia nova SH22a]
MLLNPDLVAERKKAPKAKNPPLLGWTSQMSLLADIADLIYKQLTRDGAARLARPLTAVDFVDLAKRQAAMNRVVAQFSPRHVHLTPQLDP